MMSAKYFEYYTIILRGPFFVDTRVVRTERKSYRMYLILLSAFADFY